jgi:reactive intermediate/imine deaminase
VTSRILVAALLLSPALLHSQERRYIDPRTPGDTVALPFSAAVLAGNILYLSGKIGLKPDRSVPATAEEEARLVLDDVKSTLQKTGMSMDDLVSVQVFCSDLSHYAAFNRVYRAYFTKEFPARAFIGSGPLLFNARFEVQAIAVRR